MNNTGIPSDRDTKRVSAERVDVIRGHAQCEDMGNRHTRCERHAGHAGGHHALVGVRKPCHVRWPNDGVWALYPRRRAPLKLGEMNLRYEVPCVGAGPDCETKP